MYKWTAQDKNEDSFSEDETDFKEVLELDKNSDLSMFHLTEGDRNVAVDLETGLFYINNFPFDAGLTFKNVKYRLIYYKRSRMSVGANPESQHVHAHLLGWQITLDGVNHKRIMFLYPKDHKLEMKDKR